MSTVVQRDDAPKVAFYNDPRIRAIFYQLLVIGFVLLGGWILVSNTMANLARLGVASGFGFLERPSGFDIGQTLIDYSAASTFGRAFLVGFLNTILVAVVGILLATVIGFAVSDRRANRWRSAAGESERLDVGALQRADQRLSIHESLRRLANDEPLTDSHAADVTGNGHLAAELPDELRDLPTPLPPTRAGNRWGERRE